MRAHTDLCDSVHRNAKRSAFLTALNHVAQNTFLCGQQTCISLLENAIQMLGWKLAAFVFVIFVISSQIPRTVVPFFLQHRQRQKYRDTFIAPHYEDLDDDWEHRQMRRRRVMQIGNSAA